MKLYIQEGEKKMLSYRSPVEDINTFYIPQGVYIHITGNSNNVDVAWSYYDKNKKQWFGDYVTVVDEFTAIVAQETIKILVQSVQDFINENKN